MSTFTDKKIDRYLSVLNKIIDQSKQDKDQLEISHKGELNDDFYHYSYVVHFNEQLQVNSEDDVTPAIIVDIRLSSTESEQLEVFYWQDQIHRFDVKPSLILKKNEQIITEMYYLFGNQISRNLIGDNHIMISENRFYSYDNITFTSYLLECEKITKFFLKNNKLTRQETHLDINWEKNNLKNREKVYWLHSFDDKPSVIDYEFPYQSWHNQGLPHRENNFAYPKEKIYYLYGKKIKSLPVNHYIDKSTKIQTYTFDDGNYMKIQDKDDKLIIEFFNDKNILHNEYDSAQIIRIKSNNDYISEGWYINGKLHSLDNKKASLYEYEDGQLKTISWHYKGLLHNLDSNAVFNYCLPNKPFTEEIAEYWILGIKVNPLQIRQLPYVYDVFEDSQYENHNVYLDNKQIRRITYENKEFIFMNKDKVIIGKYDLDKDEYTWIESTTENKNVIKVKEENKCEWCLNILSTKYRLNNHIEKCPIKLFMDQKNIYSLVNKASKYHSLIITTLAQQAFKDKDFEVLSYMKECNLIDEQIMKQLLY